jgi:hypothetical protein
VFCWDEPAGVLAKSQGRVGGFNFGLDSGEVTISGDIVQEEFSPAFVNSGFGWFEMFGSIGDDLQVGCICSHLSGGVGGKH